MAAGSRLYAGNTDNTVLPSYCVIQQNTMNQFQVDNANTASLFLKNMLSMMSILQFLFIALAPLAAFTMVMAGAQGLATFMKYIMFGLWTQSWLPVAALLNDYAQMTLSHQLAVIGQAVTGNAGNITAAVNAITLSGMPPAPANGLTITTIPAVLESVMQQLSIVNMMMAMTPIITMIVFTGSYMAMSSLADGITKEIDQHGGKNTGLEAPSLEAQKKAFGVSAPGNSAGSYMVTDGATAGLGYSVGNTASLASTAAQSTAATATDSATQATNHAASMTYGVLDQHGVKRTAAWKSSDTGSQEIKTAFDHVAHLARDHKTSSDKIFDMQAAYQGQLKLPGMDPEKAWNIVAGAFSGVAQGLTGKASDNLKKAIQDNEVSGWKNTLSSGEAAKFVSDISRENSHAISQDQSNKVDQAVTDGQKAEVAAQEAVAHAAKIEQQASSMRSVGGNARVDQNAIAAYFANPRNPLGPLTSHSAQVMAGKAGGYQAIEALAQAKQELAHTGQTGPALEAAALTKIGMMNPEIGLGIASQLYGDMGPGLKGMNAVQKGAQRQINDTQGNVDTAKAKLNPALQNANHAEKTADASKASGTAKQDVPTITTIPLGTDPRAYAAQGQGRILSTHQNDIAPTQFSKSITQDVDHAPGMQILSSMSPGEFLLALGATNAVTGALKSGAENLLAKKTAEKLKKSGGNTSGAPEGEKPGSPGNPSTPDGQPIGGAGSEADPPKASGPHPQETPPSSSTPDTGHPKAGDGPGTSYAERQQAVRDALNPVQRGTETVTTDATTLAEKRLTAKVGADAALSVADQIALQEAKTAILRAGEKFAAKTAAGTTIAAGAGATGIGAPIAGAIEVANVVMNVDAAVDVAQAVYQYAKTPGASEEVSAALTNMANSIMEQAGQPLPTNIPNVTP